MGHGQRNEKGELLELKHAPAPGYRKAFYIAFTLGSLYLIGLFAIEALR